MGNAFKISNLRIPGLSQIVPVLTILMEVFWSYTVVVWISQMASRSWEGRPLNLISCLILALFTEIIVRLALAGKWSVRKIRWIVVPSTLVLLAVIVRLNLGGGYPIQDPGWASYIAGHIGELVTAVIFGFYLIWRGISVGRDENQFSGLYRRFVAGLAGIIVVLIIWGFSGDLKGDVWGLAGLNIILFFGCGLLALAVANLETLRRELQQHQETTSSFSRRWLSMLIILVLAILGLSLAAAAIFSSDTGGSIVSLLGTLYDWFVTALAYILYPVGFLTMLLWYVGRWLISLVRSDIAPPQFDVTSPPDWESMIQGEGGFPIPDTVLTALKIIAILTVAGFVIFFLGRALTRYWRGKTEEGIEEVHETLGSWNLLRMDLRAMLAWLFRWMHRRRKAKPEAPVASLAGLIGIDDNDRQFTIREIYQGLLWQGRQTGSPRKAAETPYEYSRRLTSQRANLAEEVGPLTEAYIVERYGQTIPEPEKVALMNRLWRKL